MGKKGFAKHEQAAGAFLLPTRTEAALKRIIVLFEIVTIVLVVLMGRGCNSPQQPDAFKDSIYRGVAF